MHKHATAIASISKTIAVVCVVALVILSALELAGEPPVGALAAIIIAVSFIVVAVVIGTIVWGGN